MYVGINVGFELGLEQKLTPQQVQYLKLLQMTGLQLEQHIHQELELNPMLEEGMSEEQEIAQETDLPNESDPIDSDDDRDFGSELTSVDEYNPSDASNPDENSWQDYIEDEGNPSRYSNDDDHNGEPIPIQSVNTFIEDLLDQVKMLNMSEEEEIVAEEILWSVESNGYLLRDLNEIVEAVNEKIDALNNVHHAYHTEDAVEPSAEADSTPSLEIAFKPSPPKPSMESRWMVYDDTDDFTDHIEVSYGRPAKPASQDVSVRDKEFDDDDFDGKYRLQHVTLDTVEEVLFQVQTLDPPGIAARELRECLLAQFRALPKLNAAQQLAQQVLVKCYDAFKMKHYEVMMKELKVSQEYLREAMQAIRALNPKPGGGDASGSTSSIIPDFFIHYDEEKDDFIIQLNDNRVPNIRVNKLYEQMKVQVREIAKKGVKSQKMNKDAKKFFKQKYDDAKFLLQALRQRRQTMIRVMTAIVHRQREFFLRGKDFIRPLIYKNVAEDTGVDISTVCRVVNNKYTQTDYGIFELRYFFSEGLPIPKAMLDGIVSGSANGKNDASHGASKHTSHAEHSLNGANGSALEGNNEEAFGDDGMDEVSTRIVKDKLKELIDGEPKLKPLSDDKLAQELIKLGYNIARRTVAKYRDQMNIAPARLRREL
jgi:DNA-directed RNA polymerase specialized sigma54-like protein